MRTRVFMAAIPAAIAMIVGSWRFLAIAGLNNDHYMHLAAAQQILFGEWPSYQFVDLGMPLMFVLSAAAMWLTPQAPLFGEAVLVAVMFGLSAALTFYAARRLTGSIAISLLVVVVEAAIFPRTYSYPKVLAYAAGFLAMWRYVEAPTTGRLAQLAAIVVLAMLLRYDHGVYIGVGGCATVVLVWLDRGTWTIWRKVGAYAALVVGFVTPYLAYVMAGDGLFEHLRRGIELRAVENARGRHLPTFVFGPSMVEGNAVAWLFYLFHLLPLVAIAVLRLRRSTDRRELATILPLVAVAILVNFGLMRDTLEARIPDAVVPAALLIGWLLAGASRVSTWAIKPFAWTAAALLLLATAASVDVVGATREQLDRAEVLDGVGRLGRQFRDRSAQFHERLPRAQMPSRVAFALLPFFEYADRCLGPRDHVFLPAYLPEVAVWARHPFAGGQVWYQPGVLATDLDHQLVMNRLHVQRVPVAVMHPSTDAIAMQFPELGDYLRDHFPERVPVTTDDGRVLRIAFDPRLASGRDAATGWFCYR